VIAEVDLGEPRPAIVLDAVEHVVTSRANGRTYRVQVFRPAAPPPEDGYPVVLLTDGDGTFGVGAMQMCLRGGSELTPALIVGVGYPDRAPAAVHRERSFDLTPATDEALAPPQFQGLALGGAEGFRRFLIEELVPALARTHPCNPRAVTLFGYSLGGLFTLDTLFRRPGAFSAYVASSPSIWWAERQLLRLEPDFLSAVAVGGVRTRLLLTAGGLEETPTTQVYGGWSPEAARSYAEYLLDCRLIGNAREMATRLSAAGPSLPVEFRLLPGEGHGGGIAAAVVRALEFALPV
jgi:uncharacterized protein